MDNKIKLLVTQEKFDEIFSIDEWFNFNSIPQNEIYKKMLRCVVNDRNEYIGEEEARKLFNTIELSEWPGYLAAFIRKTNEAFVNPTNGG